jgi:hypothetical protein
MGKLDEQFFKTKSFNDYLAYLKAKRQQSDKMIWWVLIVEFALIVLAVGWIWGATTGPTCTTIDQGAIACTAAGMEPMTEHGTYLSMTGSCLDENKNVHRVFILENNRAIVAK